MASQSVVSSTPRAVEVSRQQEYYPLWRHVTRVKAMGVEIHGNGSAIYARRIRPSKALTQESRLTFCMKGRVLKVVHIPLICR
jgi:hypothetical protein